MLVPFSLCFLLPKEWGMRNRDYSGPTWARDAHVPRNTCLILAFMVGFITSFLNCECFSKMVWQEKQTRLPHACSIENRQGHELLTGLKYELKYLLKKEVTSLWLVFVWLQKEIIWQDFPKHMYIKLCLILLCFDFFLWDISVCYKYIGHPCFCIHVNECLYRRKMTYILMLFGHSKVQLLKNLPIQYF